MLREPQWLKEDRTSDMANFTPTLETPGASRGETDHRLLARSLRMKNWEMNPERLEENRRGPQGQGGEDAGITTQGPLTPSEER